MDLGIKNRVALVAAASRGLGKAIAFQLSKEGTKVMICARGEQRLHQARDEIASNTGGEVRAFVADVTDKRQVKDVVGKIVDEFGTIDILVSNAGGPPAGFIDDFGDEDYRKALELNLMSTVNLCYEVIPLMKKQKWGRIINLTSVSAKQPIKTLILSNTSRAGVLGFTKSISEQLAPYGITVNAICPGYTKTERIDELAQSFADSGKGSVEDFYRNIEASIPSGRFATPDEVASAAAFLASGGAAYITGVSLQIDGGYIKGLF